MVQILTATQKMTWGWAFEVQAVDRWHLQSIAKMDRVATYRDTEDYVQYIEEYHDTIIGNEHQDLDCSHRTLHEV